MWLASQQQIGHNGGGLNKVFSFENMSFNMECQSNASTDDGNNLLIFSPSEIRKKGLLLVNYTAKRIK